MRTKRLPNLEIKNKEVADDKPPMPHNLPQPYYRLNISGSSGSGKTVSWISMFDRQYPYFDKVFCISPTMMNDRKQMATFGCKDKVVIFDEPTPSLLKDIKQEIDRLLECHAEYKRVKAIFKRFCNSNYDPDVLTPRDLMALHACNFDPSTLEMAIDRPKLNLLIYMDDLQGLKILKSPTFEALIIKCRHYQTNLALCTQTFKGVSTVWRRNATAHMIFKSNDINQVKSIWEEVAGMFRGFDHFKEIYDYATAEPYSFMYIDTMDKVNPVRRNFDTVIDLNVAVPPTTSK